LKIIKRLVLISIAGAAAAVAIVIGLRVWVERRYEDRIFESIERVPPRPVALVLGAGLWPDGSLTPILTDRGSAAGTTGGWTTTSRRR